MPLVVPSLMKKHIATNKHKDALRDAEIRAGSSSHHRTHPPSASTSQGADTGSSGASTWIRQFIQPNRAPPSPIPSVSADSRPSRPPIFTPSFSASDDIVLEMDPYTRTENLDYDYQHPSNEDPFGLRLTSVIHEEVLDGVEGMYNLLDMSSLEY
jgi:hypothetical protein